MKCKVCGKEFEKNAHNQIYCSKSCKNKKYEKGTKKYKEYRNKINKKRHQKAIDEGRTNIEKNCDVCGKKFLSLRENNVYCSSDCKKKASYFGKSNKIFHHHCVICGKLFVSKSYNKKTCCDECKKEYNRKKINQYHKDKRNNDDLFRLITSYRTMLVKVFSRTPYTKKSHSYEILGCSYEFFKDYIENKFETWMTWENKGLYNGDFNYGWDIDHIIPLSTAKTEKDLINLNHYTNLQPLCSKINRDIKKDHIKWSF